MTPRPQLTNLQKTQQFVRACVVSAHHSTRARETPLRLFHCAGGVMQRGTVARNYYLEEDRDYIVWGIATLLYRCIGRGGRNKYHRKNVNF